MNRALVIIISKEKINLEKKNDLVRPHLFSQTKDILRRYQTKGLQVTQTKICPQNPRDPWSWFQFGPSSESKKSTEKIRDPSCFLFLEPRSRNSFFLKNFGFS